jgi:hypothetical protein
MRFRLNPLSPNGISEEIIIKESKGHGAVAGIQAIIAGTNITVNSSNPSKPIVSSTGSASDPFITDGTTGITKIRFQSTPGAKLYDLTIDDTGHVVTTLVNLANVIPVFFNLIPQ